MKRTVKQLCTCKVCFAAVLVLLLFSSLAQRYLGSGHIPFSNFDFYVYYFAAQSVRDDPHADLYLGATDRNPQLVSAPENNVIAVHARAAGIPQIDQYLYPPLLADLFVPLSTFPSHRAADLWRVFNLFAITASLVLLAPLFGVPAVSFEFLAFLVAAFSFFPFQEAVFIGQIVIVMFALWSIGIRAYFDGRIVLSAAAFAMATTLKITPILLLPLFLMWKDRKWILSYVSFGLGLISVMTAFNGVDSVRHSLQVLSAMGAGVPAELNKSIGSLTAWIYYRRTYTAEAALGPIAAPAHGLVLTAKLASGAFYLLCLLLAWRARKGQDRHGRAIVIALFAMVTLCTSPVSWRNAYVVAFVALAIYWARALRNPPGRLRLTVLALATAILGTPGLDYAAKAQLPRAIKIMLSGSWVVISMLFVIECLLQEDVRSRSRTRGLLERTPSGVYREASGNLRMT